MFLFAFACTHLRNYGNYVIIFLKGVQKMNQYQKPYYILFNSITAAIEELENSNFGKAKEILIEAQKNSEEEYISFAEK